jgi:ribosomal protein S18 acetylase RimI-like enzyme
MPGDKVRKDEEFIKSLGFGGRLWRDPQVTTAEAVRETQNYIRNHPNIYTVGKYPAAIGLFTGPRIDLIGVVPEARGLGLAEMLIRAAIDGKIIAGTYSDNMGAKRLYRKLGMEITKTEDVYHK